MSKLTWTDELKVNIENLDFQHEQYFAICDTLDVALDNKQETAVLLDALSNLIAFSQKHFEREEDLMRTYKYPLLSEHAHSHSQFIAKLEQLHEDTSAGKIHLSIVHTRDCRGIFLRHIKEYDVKISEFLDARYNNQ